MSSRAVLREAFGLTIDQSTKADVLAWGARAGATCGETLGAAAIRCEGARVDEGPRAADAFFQGQKANVVQEPSQPDRNTFCPKDNSCSTCKAPDAGLIKEAGTDTGTDTGTDAPQDAANDG